MVVCESSDVTVKVSTTVIVLSIIDVKVTKFVNVVSILWVTVTIEFES